MGKMIKKTFEFECKSTDEAGVYEAVITTSQKDRDNEVLLSTGMDPSDFKKTGTVFYNHDYNLPIGKALEITKGRKRWTAKIKMAERPDGFEGEFFPEYIKTLMDQKIIRGISVGFLVEDSRRPTKKDTEDYGEDVWNIVTRWKLMEVSIVTIPSNINAVITSVKNLDFPTEIANNIVPETYVKEVEEMDEVDIIEEQEEKQAEINAMKKGIRDIEKETEIVDIELSPAKKRKIKEKVTIELAKRRGQLYIKDS